MSHHPTRISFPIPLPDLWDWILDSSHLPRGSARSLLKHPALIFTHRRLVSICALRGCLGPLQESTHGKFLSKLIPSRWKQSAQLRREGGEAHDDRAYLVGVWEFLYSITSVMEPGDQITAFILFDSPERKPELYTTPEFWVDESRLWNQQAPLTPGFLFSVVAFEHL